MNLVDEQIETILVKEAIFAYSEFDDTLTTNIEDVINKMSDFFKTYLRFKVDVKTTSEVIENAEFCITYKDSKKNSHTLYATL